MQTYKSRLSAWSQIPQRLFRIVATRKIPERRVREHAIKIETTTHAQEVLFQPHQSRFLILSRTFNEMLMPRVWQMVKDHKDKRGGNNSECP